MKKQQKKAVRTKRQREKIFEKFENRATNKRLKWNYEKAKEVDVLSRRYKVKPETIFRKLITESKKRKTYYISKKYNVDKIEAGEILELSLKNHTSYKKEIEEKEKHILPVLYMNFLDLIDFTQKTNIRPDAKVNFTLFGTAFDVNINTWNEKERLEARKILEKESDSDYPVLDDEFEIETETDKDGNIYNINIQLSKNNDLEENE